MVKRGDMMNIDDMIDILAIELLGVVPEDEQIVISLIRGPAVQIHPQAGQAYRNTPNGNESRGALIKLGL